MIASVLFVCTGNICRSPMAAAVFTHALAGHARDEEGRPAVGSAGLAALVGHPADNTALALLERRGIDAADHRARAFDGALGLASDLILTMTLEQRHFIESRWPLLQGRVFALGCWDDVEIEDPYRQDEAAFERVLEEIDRAVAAWLPRITRR